MSYQVSQKKVDALMKKIEKDFPDLQIIYKDEPLPASFLVKFIFFMVRLAGFFNSSFEKVWMERFANTVGKKWIMLPSRSTHGDFKDFHTYKVLRHEYVHLKDYSLWFFLTYILLPLPILVTGRAHWELRGYAQNMLVDFEEFGKISDAQLEWIASKFTGGMYFWMFPFKKKVEKKLKKLRQAIYDREVQGFHPDVKFYGKEVVST